jgi:hypothetical protein
MQPQTTRSSTVMPIKESAKLRNEVLTDLFSKKFLGGIKSELT